MIPVQSNNTLAQEKTDAPAAKPSIWDKLHLIAGGVVATNISGWLIRHSFITALFGFGGERNISEATEDDRNNMMLAAGAFNIALFFVGFWLTKVLFKKLENRFPKFATSKITKVLWILVCGIIIALIKPSQHQ